MLNTTTTARDSSGAGRSANLLNLLRYSTQNGQSSNSQSYDSQSNVREGPSSCPQVIHAPAPTAADPSGLLAALMRGHPADSDKQEQEPERGPEQEQEPAPAPGLRPTWNQGQPSDRTQDYLLSLLHRPKPESTAVKDEQKLHTESPRTADTSDPTSFIPMPSRAQFDYRAEGAKAYPLEDPSGASPVHQTPKASTTPASQAGTSQAASLPGQSVPPIQILEKADSSSNKRSVSERSWSANITSPDHTRQKTDHTISPLSHISSLHVLPPPHDSPRSQVSSRHPLPSVHDSPRSHKESVTEAVSHLAERADTEAQEAIARAEKEIALAEKEQHEAGEGIARDLENLMTAKSDQESLQSAQIAATAIKKELDKEDNQSVLEDHLDADGAEAVKHFIDEAAQASQSRGMVADSWESADADEIVVLEEGSSPVKVYNLPMKPWISITIQASEERATFPVDGILDIARLKKEFDQVDRNLVSSTEVHLTYGMSKAGGFRVIRQEDGKDARLFTDTQDRIFNVAMSVSAPGLSPKESVLCTGVSGTVYWVELTNGDRSHLDDTNPEQYGFALPPITAHEGDTPGGVLKTRARISAAHPEFFAVGRGKAIHIVWPHFVFRHNLFKSGHDRIVDTEKLLQQCSLKINTGKAGKDFTFSQDDTMVVSLDKSGRVKFWDVRDLTAADSSDPARPLPAHSSLEVKEPLMTLTTTPDREKAWPTSVLLLDKFRPYQRRTALRYMIVGMKQNHTLQLWDLALGKAVQEINFPHSNESDGVCSIAYHAPTSMIVVGHPTRNSIYFLHLSAPKYTLKTLSQVEFMQRLHAKDASIPSPDVTAVISGIREFSMAPKGLLRSCSILENPAAQGSGGEPVLFELYAMHSKGVTAFCVKQAELGWSGDNKIISPVDAVEAGMAKVSKLAAPDAIQPESHTAPQIRIATRNSRDLLQKASSSQGDELKNMALQTPVRLVERPKEREAALETPPPAYTPGEKVEKRNRKKKGAATDAATTTTTTTMVARAGGAGAGATSFEFAAGPSSGSATGLGALPGAPKREALPTNGDVTRTTAQLKAVPTKLISRNGNVENPPTTTTSALRGNQEFEQLIANKLRIMETQILDGVEAHADTLLHDLSSKLQEMLKLRDQEFAVHQATLLDTVSKVLTTNTDDALAKIVRAQFDKTVVPLISDQFFKMADTLGGRISKSLKQDVHQAIPAAINQALQQPDVLKSYLDRIASEIIAHTNAQTPKAVNSAVVRMLPNSLAKFSSDLLADMDEKLAQQQRNFDDKLGKVVEQVSHLADTVKNVANSQLLVQQDVRALTQLFQQRTQQSPSTSHPTAVSAAHHHVNAPAMHAQLPMPMPMQMPMHMPTQMQTQIPTQEMLSHEPFYAHGAPYSHRKHQDRQVVRQPMVPQQRAREDLANTVAKVMDLMRDHNYEQAAISWITAGDENMDEVFKNAILPFGTSFVPEMSPLLMLTVAQLLTKQLNPEAELHNGESHVLRSKLSLIDALIQQFAIHLPNQVSILGVFNGVMFGGLLTRKCLSRICKLCKSRPTSCPTSTAPSRRCSCTWAPRPRPTHTSRSCTRWRSR